MAAEAAISSVVQLLGNLLIHKVKFIRGVEGQVELLIEELSRMHSFLRDANKKQARDDRVRNWISDIREVALDAEDTIEMFTLNVENASTSRCILQRCVCFPKHARHLHRIGKEIESIRARLNAIRENRETYGIEDLGEPAERSEVEARRRLAPCQKDENLVGMEDDVKKLLEPIVDEEKRGLIIAAIVGMGGIGKSTLAREVYNHPDVVSGRFDCRAWVVVSSEFTPEETVKQLILETTNSEQQKQLLCEETKQLEESTRDRSYLRRKLEEMLHQRLKGKTYFIVLDDVWEKEHWDSLMSVFPNEKEQKSRLLLTTRNKVMANHCQSLHQMKGLDTEKSWELFLKKGVASNSHGEFPKELEPIGREIVEKCEGLPLAITVMGGLLGETQSNKEWEEALNELDSHLGRAESNVSAILELSYQNLSPQLKSCFLCLAFFKEDATIPVKRLLNIMVGQCLIKKIGRTTAEEIARGCLDELISRNMVQVKDLTFDNRVKNCHLHDSLRNICLEKAKEEIGLEILMGDRMTSLHKPRHCVMKSDDLGSLSMDKNKHIRSLFVVDDRKDLSEIKPSYWKSFQHLKTLDLDRCHCGQTLPRSFRLLLGLTQLRLSRQHHSMPLKLPTWLNTLKKLELLDMRTESVEFINVALKMDNLRHIHAQCVQGLSITDSWKNVETLKYIKQEDWMRSSLRMTSTNDECRIRELGILLDRESSSLRGSLERLENLVKLHLAWNYFHPIDATIIPHIRNLTKLKLRGKISKSLTASMFPPNLSHLTLEKSYLHQDPMQELSKLPKLSYLKLKYNSYMGERMQVSHDGFPSLRGLSLQLLYELRSVDVEEAGMPQLNLLQVDRCYSLDTKNLSNKSYQLQVLTHTIQRKWHWRI